MRHTRALRSRSDNACAPKLALSRLRCRMHPRSYSAGAPRGTGVLNPSSYDAKEGAEAAQ
eukprot:549264-Pyramimonas_sp.AAC.1